MSGMTITELLRWHDASKQQPDADTTVLLWVVWPDGGQDWCAGWLDGHEWRLCESGGLCDGNVLWWAEPCGPEGAL